MKQILKHRKEITQFWLELRRELFLKRAYALENDFYRSFFVQCIESTMADGYEMFLESAEEHNYFRQRLDKLNEHSVDRFYKLAGIHHAIRTAKKRKKELQWQEIREALVFVYRLNEEEQRLCDVLYECICTYQTGFQELFIKTTVRYLFNEKEMSAFSFAFIGNFWYNSYSSFMGSFTGYLPFHVSLLRAN